MSNDIERIREALLWFADEGHYADTYRHGAGFVDAVGLSKARDALGLPVDRSDGTPMPLDEAIAEAGGQVLPLKRTPETVLRAMLRAYGDAEVDARIEARRDLLQHARRAAHFHVCRDEIVCELAEVADGWPGPDLSQPGLQADYEARLAGRRPLDAPPLEEP